MKKTNRKLIPAVAMLLVSAIMLSTSSFAWFSMNSVVTADGMNVKAKAGSNLLISKDGTTAGKAAESTFKAEVTWGGSATLLAPASTTDGLKFFYTAANDGLVNADGSKDETATFYEYTPSTDDADFNAKSGTSGAVPYKDFYYQIQATADAASELRLNELKLTNTVDADVTSAYRVAVFIKEISSSASGAGTWDPTKTPDASAIFTKSGAGDLGGKTAKAEGAGSVALVGVPVYNTLENNAIAVAKDGEAHYFAVTIRVYLEGQDTECNNAKFMNLSDEFTLSVKFALDTASGSTYNNVDQLTVVGAA